jgi:hypothetical protein
VVSIGEHTGSEVSISDDTENRRRRPVPWLRIASLLVAVARLLVEVSRRD